MARREVREGARYKNRIFADFRVLQSSRVFLSLIVNGIFVCSDEAKRQKPIRKQATLEIIFGS